MTGRGGFGHGRGLIAMLPKSHPPGNGRTLFENMRSRGEDDGLNAVVVGAE